MSAYKFTGFLCILVLAGVFIYMASSLPEVGSFQNKQVAIYYLVEGLEKTGSPNIVNSIVWDFRGYDTLGEETVLFTAGISVLLVAWRRKNG